MRKQAYTISVDPTIAAKIEKTVKPFGGKVVTWAAALVEDMGRLEAGDQQEVRALIEAKLTRHRNHESPRGDIGLTPLVSR